MRIIKTAIFVIVSLFMGSVALLGQDSFPDSSATTDTVRDSMTSSSPDKVSLVYTMDVTGAINAVTDMRIENALELADEDNAELLVILMDTPGGYTETTWRINKRIFNSDVPVCVYVAPSGSRAGSAGVYISYAAHFSAMAPATNIGSAHPVGSGGEDIDSNLNEKITNDAVAKIRTAAERHGRNADWAERAVRESVNITEKQALDSNVVNFIAVDVDDLLKKLDGQVTELPNSKKTMSLTRYRVEHIGTTFVERLLAVITDPNVVLILFSIGGLGIVLELYNPGSIFPGVVGAFSLIIAFYASSVLPINYAGVALIFLAILLFILEAKIASMGLLTIGGTISLFLGGLMLIDTTDPALGVSLGYLIPVVIVVVAIISIVLFLVVKASKRQVAVGNESLIGKIAEVRREGMAYVEGALWKIESDDPLETGDKVTVVAVSDLKLKVKKNKITGGI